MPASNVCWGIEVGAAAIKAVKLENLGDGKCRLVDWAIVQHPKVLSTPGVDPNDVIRVSLGQFTNQVDLSKAAIAISVPGHSSFARFAKLPPVEPKKVAEIIKFEAAQQIPFPLEQVEWDYQTFVTPDSPELEVGIFAITKERVQEQLSRLDDVGITPDFVVQSPIAVYNALAYDLDFGDKTPGTIIVDIGTTSTDLVVATPGRMWVRTFPLGGHQFTEALVNQFQLSYPKAEKLKREAQDTKHARQVFQAMRPVFTDLAQDIQRSIGYFQSLNRDAELTRVIGVGATWNLPGLRKYLKQQLGLDVYRIDTYKKVGTGGGGFGEDADSEEGTAAAAAADPNDRNAQFNKVSLEMATAYGLALQGLGLNSVSGNLMPTTLVRRSMWREKGKWFGMAAGVAAAAAGVMFINPLRNYFAVNSPDARPDAMIQQTLRQANDLKRQADEAQVTTAGTPDFKAANLVALQDKREAYQYVVADLQAMFADANARKDKWAEAVSVPGQPPVTMPDGPALRMMSVQTMYLPPVDPNAAPSPDRASRTESDQESFVNWTEEHKKYPRIEVLLTVDTAVPEPRKFMQAAVQQWLRDNARREGLRADLPYELVYTGSFLLEETAAADTAGMSSGSPTASSQEQGGRRNTRDARESARSMLGGTRRNTRQATNTRAIAGEAAAARVASGEGLSVSEMAPLDAPADMLATGTANAAFAFGLVFKPPTPPSEGTDAGTGTPTTGGTQ